eukprot:6175344-Pleurochrysis_carterae.AAC.1
MKDLTRGHFQFHESCPSARCDGTTDKTASAAAENDNSAKTGKEETGAAPQSSPTSEENVEPIAASNMDNVTNGSAVDDKEDVGQLLNTGNTSAP